jgi:hypothetical protein
LYVGSGVPVFAIKYVLRPASLMHSAMKLTFWNSPRCCRTSVTHTCAGVSSSVNMVLNSAGDAAIFSASYCDAPDRRQ